MMKSQGDVRRYESNAKRRSNSLILAAFALLAVSAAPTAPPDDSIRRGNTAFEAGEYNDALQFYRQAEERGTDPGLIAFNAATAYYQLNDFRRAEGHYRMALDDRAIPSERRARALYNLGNCLVKGAGEENLRALRDAVRCYELCLDAGPDEGLRTDAAYNLEVAKLLWNRARSKAADPPPPNADDPPDAPPKPPEPKKSEPPKTDDGPGKKEEAGKKELAPTKGEKDGKAEAKAEMKKADGPPRDLGPPVPPDTSEVEKQSPEDTVKALRVIEKRLHDERQRLRREAATPEAPSGRDW
jgi:tetratricopeptide (TPR) repeat protein